MRRWLVNSFHESFLLAGFSAFDRFGFLCYATGLCSTSPCKSDQIQNVSQEFLLGTKKSGKGRRKLGRKKRRMRSKIRHRKD